MADLLISFYVAENVMCYRRRRRRRRLSVRDLKKAACGIRPRLKSHKEQSWGSLNVWQLRKQGKSLVPAVASWR